MSVRKLPGSNRKAPKEHKEGMISRGESCSVRARNGMVTSKQFRVHRDLKLPQAMLDRWAEMDLDMGNFVPALLEPPTQAFRINTLKGDRKKVLSLLSRLEPEPVGWNELVFRVRKRTKLGNLLEHFLGLIYVQDASSTIPVTVLDPQPYEEILDMSAAPGSKSTQIAGAMANAGLLVANDVAGKRMPALTGNLDRSGVMNAVVTRQPGQAYGHIAPDRFDRVLLDAPCSSEGTLPRSFRVLEIWSEGAIKRLANTQRNLILSAYHCLRPGGTLVYSTCTFAPEENEGTLTHLLNKFPDAVVEPIHLPGLNSRPGYLRWRGEEYHPAVTNIIRLFPHIHDGEGFCVAKIRKPPVLVTHTSPHPTPPSEPSEKKTKRLRSVSGKKSVNGSETEAQIIQRTLDSFEERLGIERSFFSNLHLFMHSSDAWCCSKAAGEVEFPHTVRRGIRLARVFPHTVKPTTNAVQLLGPHITRSRVELEERETRRFLAGLTQEVKVPDDVSDGFVVAFHAGYALGVGLLKGQKLKSQVPRSRRVLSSFSPLEKRSEEG